MSRRPQVVRLAAAAVLVPLALGSLAACGDDGDEPSSAKSESSASADSGTQPTAAFTPGEEIDKAEFIKLYSDALEGATTSEFTMTTTTQGQEIEVEGEMDYASTPPAMAMTLEIPGTEGEMDIRLVDNVMYMTIPGMADGKFVELDLDDPANPLGSMSSQMDPRAQIETFSDGLTSATFEGTEDVDGEKMDHFTVTVDTAAMLKESGMDAATREQALKQAPKALEYEIWFDADGMFRRMDYDMGEQLGAMTMELSDWGTDVEIEAPPADEISDKSLAELMGGAGGGGA